MKRTIFLALILTVWGCCIPGASAQSVMLDHFQALQSYGQIPDDFLNCMHGSFQDPQQRAADTASRKQIRMGEKFRLMTDYYRNELLTSGHVVFGDPIGNYVNKVADSLLAAFPDLRRQLRFYVTKSVAANAYSTDEGIIFINIGLIARVKNEAQLAFILAHEIVHYVRKHNITIFIEKQNAYRRRSVSNEYRDLSLSEKIMRVNYRSKEIETLADHDALTRYFAYSSYDAQQIEGVFDVLLYAAYPFTNEPFDLSLLETRDMILPDYYLVDDVEKLKVDENEADSMSTHPNVRKRKEVIRALVDSIPEYGTRTFLHDAAEFNEVVNLARFEVLRQLIIDHQLIEALFCASSMLHDFPGNLYIKKCFAASLYGIASYKEAGHISDITQPTGDVAGEMSQVNYMVSRLNSRDLNVLALNYAWRLKQQFPADEYLSGICDDLFRNIVIADNIPKSFFYSKTLAELRLELASTPAIPDTVLNSTRHRKKKTSTSKIDTTFTKFAFVDLMKDSAFTTEFSKWESRKDSVHAAEELARTFHATKNQKKECKPVQEMVMPEPYTIKLDTRKRDEVKYEESASSAARVRTLLIANAKRVNVKINLAGADSLKAGSVKEYNEMSFINEYLTERFNQSEEGILNSFCKVNIDPVMHRFNSSYLGWMGITSVQKKKPVARLCVMSILPYLWPYTIYEFVTPKIHSTYYYVLFNVKSGRVVLSSTTTVRSELRNDQLNSHIYDFMYQTHKTYEK